MLGIVPEVKLGDLMSGEEDVPDSIVSCRTNSHWHALEGLRYLEDTAKELEPTFVVNTAYQVGWFVLQGWKDLGKQSLAHLVLGGRSSKVKGEYAERVKYLDAEALGRQVFRASRLFFERLAQDHQVILVFEDLHWMDESSARLLDHLLPLVRRIPLLVCCITRPDSNTAGARMREIAAKGYAESYTEVVLSPSLSLYRPGT